MEIHELTVDQSKLRAGMASHPAGSRNSFPSDRTRDRATSASRRGWLYRFALAIRDASENLGYDGPLFPPTDH